MSRPINVSLRSTVGSSDASSFTLHRFRIHGKDYGIARPGGMGFADDPWQVRLCDFRLHWRALDRHWYHLPFI